MSVTKYSETIRLLNDEIKAKVEAGSNIPTKPEHKWRDITELTIRLITVIPPEQTDLINDLQEYSKMICSIGPFVVKAGYTRDLPLQVMRKHIATIAEQYSIPIDNTKTWTIRILWHTHFVEIYHNVRYDAKALRCPYVCTFPCIDDL
jgi:hypothetical protein